MDSLKFKGDLNIAKGKLKQRWAKLIGDDFQFLEGKQDEMMGRLQKRAAETRDAVVKAIKRSRSEGGSNSKETSGVASPRNPAESS